MAGRPSLDDDEMLVIGTLCVQARVAGTSWKVLQRQHDRSRVTLWRYARAALDAGWDETPLRQDETSAA